MLVPKDQMQAKKKLRKNKQVESNPNCLINHQIPIKKAISNDEGTILTTFVGNSAHIFH